MNESRSLHREFESASRATTFADTIKVIALYDGFTSAVYAHEAVGSLTMTVKPFAHVEDSGWSFDMLARLDLRHSAVRVAAEADVIIVAADPARALPFHVQSWLIRSLQENAKGVPLIVLIDQEDYEQAGGSLPLHEGLATVASRWGTPLLRNDEFDALLEDGLAAYLAIRRGTRGSGVIFDGLHSPHPAGRWGINE